MGTFQQLTEAMAKRRLMTDAEVDELLADKEAILARVLPACEMLIARGNEEPFLEIFNVLTGNGAHVPKVRRDVLADNERLRGLIERAAAKCIGDTSWCPFCDGHHETERSKADCPALTPDGKAR